MSARGIAAATPLALPERDGLKHDPAVHRRDRARQALVLAVLEQSANRDREARIAKLQRPIR